MPRGKKVSKAEETNDLPLKPRRVPTHTQGKMSTLKAIEILQNKGYQILPPEPLQRDVDSSLGIKQVVGKKKRKSRKVVLHLKLSHTLGSKYYPAGVVELDSIEDREVIQEILHQEQLALNHEKELFGPSKFYFVVEREGRSGQRAFVGLEVSQATFLDEAKAPVLATLGMQDVLEGGGVVY